MRSRSLRAAIRPLCPCCESLGAWASLRIVRAAGTLLGAGAVAGAGLTAYAAVGGPRSTRCARSTVPLLPAGHAPLRVLHLSDMHMTPGQTRKQEWLRSPGRARPRPGDQHRRQPRPSRRRYPPCSTPTATSSTCRGCSSSAPTTTTSPPCATRCSTCCPTTAPAAPAWPSCPGPTSRSPSSSAAGSTSPTASVDRRARQARRSRSPASTTPTSSLDDLSAVAGPADDRPTCAWRSRTRRTCGSSTSSHADGYDAVIAGHTHGGQVCLPGVGALTTNCDLDNARAKGLHRHPADSRPGDPGSVLAARVGRRRHQSPYARIRVACRPEATLLTLTAQADGRPIGSAAADSVARRRSVAHRGLGLWRSLVARLVRDEEAAGSNPVSPTNVQGPGRRSVPRALCFSTTCASTTCASSQLCRCSYPPWLESARSDGFPPGIPSSMPDRLRGDKLRLMQPAAGNAALGLLESRDLAAVTRRYRRPGGRRGPTGGRPPARRSGRC